MDQTAEKPNINEASKSYNQVNKNPLTPDSEAAYKLNKIFCAIYNGKLVAKGEKSIEVEKLKDGELEIATEEGDTVVRVDVRNGEITDLVNRAEAAYRVTAESDIRNGARIMFIDKTYVARRPTRTTMETFKRVNSKLTPLGLEHLTVYADATNQ